MKRQGSDRGLKTMEARASGLWGRSRGWAVCVLCWGGVWAWADGLQALDQFLRQVQQVQGEFTQVVTSPPRQGESVGRKKTSSGAFALARPGKFRFDYRKPFEQSMVSDGQTLWIWDADLEQLTQKKLADVVQGTPAVVLSASSVQDIAQSFALTALPDREGLQWVKAVPKQKDGSIQSVELGFSVGGGAAGTAPAAAGAAAPGVMLQALRVADGLGQISTMQFSAQSTAPLSATRFVFKANR